ncbi:M20/M25/M40 family metallo-hydrolase [Jeotgalicoccus sp. WY2]|uniref:M20/M25/M40 family metallo-hydrolase n=1 Tax=Jeotgalicoccus sp. WY2 TaxID=2708346 RepID=UPI002021DE24|nr:M20/M25/M40 family metallo-hydrolase [Jeotgalicoccus sp. WY2]
MKEQGYLWESPAQLEALLYELVGWNSLSGTQGEIDFPHKLIVKFKELDYFKTNPDNIQLFDAGKERNAFTALYKTDKSSDTVVLISHFDTVGTEEYGQLQDLAFNPEKLTQAFRDKPDFLTPDAKEDLYTDQYIFGRGTMDMKMGLALHMHLIEQAVNEDWPVNLLLVTVPDEEVSSRGMLAAVPGILELSKTNNLNLKLFLNGEPSFTQQPLDENHYIYSLDR